MKTKIFLASIMNIADLEFKINNFCEGKNVKNIMIQEASDLIVCMVVYDENENIVQVSAVPQTEAKEYQRKVNLLFRKGWTLEEMENAGIRLWQVDDIKERKGSEKISLKKRRKL